ncbi:MAG TPA: tripartite tricarboxylate transporter TctB family protein [Burkholderiales bacterium]|nr:tripartite tricarboxylate transporter TctB family protein [Burkholderiales bacterium]
MAEHGKGEGVDAGVISQRTADLVMALAMFAIGVVMMIDNYQIGAGWAKDGPQSGYFPFRIGAIICIAAVIVFVQAMLARSDRTKAFVTRARLKPVLLVLIPTLIYVGAIQLIGIYVASAVFIAAFMRLMDRYSWVKTLAISIGMNVILFWLFEVQFLVPLPKGPLEALFGY